LLDRNQPLWLPEGSVRAIIALFSVVAIIAFFIVVGGEVAIAALSVALGSIITFYFTKEKQQGEQAELEAYVARLEDELIED